ncbi:MAG: hypothetical protein FWG18_03650, partial [Alphaproteobacteria bacterium]|nr:hypothetical protein [Alphaproteobacteria bacterium]
MGDKTLVQYFNDHRKMVHDYATGETDVAPDVTAPMFQEFTDLFGREFDTNGKLKPELAPWGQAARDRFNREHPGRGREPVQNNGGDDIYRLRSQRSDTNEFMLEGITARIYHDMKIINDATFARAQQSRQDAMDVVLGVNLSEKQQKEYSVRLAIDIAHNTEMLELVPPMTLAFAYKGLKARIAKANTQEKAMLQPRLDAITARIDQLIENFARHIEYHFLDLTNIGDVHKGYEAMFAAREADLDQRRNSELIRQIGANRTRMQSFIQDFDQEWGFNGLTPADAKTLNDRYGDLAAKLADKNVSDEVMADIAKYIFYDENNQPIPQFINERTGQPSLEFIPGVTTLDPLSKLGRIIDLVRDEVTRRNLGKTPGANGAAATFQNKTAAQLQKDLDENIQFKLFSMDASEKIIGGALSDPELEAVDKFTNLEEHLTKFITEMKEGKRGVSAGTYECALDAEVNEVAGWASRAADFVGKDAEVLEKPFKAIEDIDSRATGRFEKGRADKRATKSALIKRTALNSGSAFLTSAAITTVATASSDILGLADGRMIIGGAIGGVLAITSVARSISQWKKDRKAEGKATGVKAFFKDLFKKDGGKERSLGTKLLASASAAAAMGFAMTGNVATATTLGAVAVGLGGGATAVHNYKDAVAAGHGKGFATGLGIMSAASVVLSGFAGRLAAGWGIDAYNAHNPTNTDFQTMTGSEGETTIPGADTTTIVYKPDALAGMERIERMWYNTDGPTIAKYDAMVSGTDVPRSVLSVIAGDIGVRTDDNMLLHNQWGPNVNSGGLHTVITPEVVKGWSDVDYSEIVQLKDALRAGTPLDGDLTDIVHRVAGHMNERNQIEYWGKNAAYQNDRVLGLIANRAADGSSVATAPGTGNSFITQTGLTNPGLHETITIPGEDVTTQWDDRVWTPNPQPMFTDNIPGGIGMFGVYQSSAPKQSGLRNRAGAILDRTPKRPVQTTGRGNPEGGGNPNPHGPGGGGEYWLGDPNEINDPYMDDLIRKAEEAAKEVRRRTREEQHIPVKKPDLPEVDPNIIPEKYRKIH